jgi:hypothetical protein
METSCSSETSVDFQWTASRYIPEDTALQCNSSLQFINLQLVQRQAADWAAGVRFPAEIVLHVVQTDYGAHPDSYQISTDGSFPGVKESGA